MDAVIFDLDGTLWDTCNTCAIAWNKVLNRNGIAYREIRAEDVQAVTGRPHKECIDLVFSDLDRDMRNLLCDETSQEDNKAVSELGGEIYPGVTEGLKSLVLHFPLCIVSNCQSGYIESFLEYSGFEELFTDNECWGNTGNTKGENLASLIDRNQFSQPVFIGDTVNDKAAAEYCGIPFVQVTYGFSGPLHGSLQVRSFPQLVELIGRKVLPRFGITALS